MILFRLELFDSSFSPDTSNYDAYGLKIAANDVIFVEAQGDEETYLVQFAPFDYAMGSLQCSFDYDDSTHYVYSVGVGQKQNTTKNSYFYFAGEVVPAGFSKTDMSGHNGTFIGIWINTDPHDITVYTATRQPLPCIFFQAQKLQFLNSYGHQEFFVIAVEPYGTYAIGLATSFAFTYRPFPSGSITPKAGSSIWPNNSTFNPCAADASNTYTIVAGFVAGAAGSRVRATPTVYLIWNSNLTVLSTWSYSATSNSWQSRLTYSGVSSWSSKFTMSVKINSDDPTRVLVGMPFLNTVFLFVVDGTTLTLASYVDHGQSVGFGKGVTWLTNSQAAILVSTYSLDYTTWYSSQIYVYTSLNDTDLPSSPSAIIPNTQQPLPSTINSILLRIVSTPESVVVLDAAGGALIILSEAAGYYASTDTTNAPVAASMPVVSHSTTCIGGTYKSDIGIHPCKLCSSGTKNLGTTAGISCMNCSSDSFCPLGAVYEINSTLLISLSQAYSYPRSPEMTNFEDVLLNNMFSMGSTMSCLIVSPIFWSLILTFIFILILLIMASLGWCVQPSKRDRYRAAMKTGEGELWAGGIASIAVVLITIMAYTFSISYMNQYPAEKTQGSRFSCDSTLRNAKFESSLQALAVPVPDDEQTIFDLLNDQNFTLQFDFINTAASCMTFSISEVTDVSTTALPISSCNDINGTLQTTVKLPEHAIVLQVVISDIQLIGGLRIGLLGSGVEKDTFTLQELNFLQTFYSPSSETLAQIVTIDMALTKVINETDPLFGDTSDFAGIWYPTFTYSLSEMFISSDYYLTSANLTSTTITIDITETSYYIKNIQSPIAKEPEIIFRTLLFAFLCLEICAMAFLICRLLIMPLINKIYMRFTGHPIVPFEPEHGKESNHQHH
ncbi:unnamed protein product [Adineta steineri]|uniref:Transmembrane protein n=1 Tax=Adineta steineri TaxID=433720 RepID=A0A815FGW8_9BILA|nr:unnamed protein product [Adineta steineri]CAF1586711.1 unnamed protein product [Adineta steineri]